MIIISLFPSYISILNDYNYLLTSRQLPHNYEAVINCFKYYAGRIKIKLLTSQLRISMNTCFIEQQYVSRYYSLLSHVLIRANGRISQVKLF